MHRKTLISYFGTENQNEKIQPKEVAKLHSVRNKRAFGDGRNAGTLGLLSSSVPEKVEVMINFMCQLAWAIGFPDKCSNIILDVSVTVFG